MPTNFFPENGTIQVSLSDENGYAIECKCLAADIPSAVAGYATGCELIAEDTGAHYYNTGDEASCTFTVNSTVTAGSIVNADVNASAAIAYSKLAALTS